MHLRYFHYYIRTVAGKGKWGVERKGEMRGGKMKNALAEVIQYG